MPLPNEWRYLICDLAGTPISVITRLTFDKQAVFPLYGASSLSGRVPSGDPLVNIEHTDGDPYLNEGNRQLIGLRRDAVGSPAWTLRFAGTIWHVEDAGDEQGAYTSFVAYDPWQMLTKRPVLDEDGSETADVDFVEVAGNEIAKTLIDRSITHDGDLGIDIDTGTFETTSVQTLRALQGRTVADVLLELCDTGTMDIVLTPTFNVGSTLAVMNVYAVAGTDRSSGDRTVSFVYDDDPYSIASINRARDVQLLANRVHLYGGRSSAKGGKYPSHSTATSSSSVTKYGTHVFSEVLSEITSQNLIDSLATQLLADRKEPIETVAIVPTVGSSPAPFTDYWLGDRVHVSASSRLRRAFDGVQRIYKVTLDIDDNGIERVSELIMSPSGL